MNRFICCVLFFALLATTGVLNADQPPVSDPKTTTEPKTKPGNSSATPSTEWRELKGSWKAAQFGGDGPIEIKGNSIKMGVGDPLTGVHWTGDAAKDSFEIELEARRTDGFDFFCGLTFPVGDSHVTYVLGGWGGGVVGISNIDGMDASENEQTYYQTFDMNRWYKVRVRVDPHQIQCWIDDKISVEQPRLNHTFDLRFGMELCEPIGLAAYQCDAEYRKIRVRTLSKAELAEAKKAADLRASEDE
ncbi:hypothetical protein K227x_38750 [Rubripirellula lacrimiformis]|uniref:3-keto-alpha-glucoside-1,2-lyase/3-keto-2-hydroxy-glucal hydratase domain-containing protein n=1 Tax=Rubripirellula lacrimiformis TaxID=1930273 RepID=A0A517NEB7_9BACT|nr:DUF1080 domain-containing protein [Rubripirellula lacrimiformis]QDT05475.1 hypothetical protein K227x_38750 [Rubripirellula lacrimiformis]